MSVHITDDSDAVLVLQCKSGNRHAFEALLARYERQVFGAVFRILHHREDATDVTQTAFLRAYEHLDRYDPGQRFSSWLYRIAVNEALDLVRSRRPSEPLLDDTLTDSAGPVEMAVQDENESTMRSALMDLKIDYRTVIVLKHLQDCTYEEMAQILECPVKTVKSRLFTARQALRDVLVARGHLK
ncbi:MAG: RNA polymerase sigma factor [Rudaea sp.]